MSHIQKSTRKPGIKTRCPGDARVLWQNGGWVYYDTPPLTARPGHGSLKKETLPLQVNLKVWQMNAKHEENVYHPTP